MEAGYDYLLIRTRLQRGLFKYSGLFLLALGLLLLAGTGAYYGYAAKARADLDKLNFTVPEAITDGPAASSELSSPPFGAAEDLSSDRSSVPSLPGGESPSDLLTIPDEDVSETGISPSTDSAAGESDLAENLAAAIANQQLQLGESLPASFWANPLYYEPISYVEQTLLQGFTPMDMSQAPPVGSQAAPQRIIIPASEIDVDSMVSPLQILNLGDSRAYETPKNTVGHIPESANPGEHGGSWFFGHLESPIMGGGAVFYDLPKIPSLLREGKKVYIITDNGTHQFLYQVVKTTVVHQNDMALHDSGQATIHLVACVPRLVYDHRLIVTGQLVGVKNSPI